MTRYFKTAEGPNEFAENLDRSNSGFEQTESDYVFEQAGDALVIAEAHWRPREHAVKFEQRHGPEFQAEPAGVYVMSTPHHILLAHLRERLPAPGGGAAVEEQDSEAPAGGDARPEAEWMLGRVLDAGGTEIVERLKEQEAQIASAECSQPEIGRLVAAYYVPLLLTALALSDEEFDAEYPGEGNASAKQRAELADVIQSHAQVCPRCSLKASSDWEWDEHVDHVFDGHGRRFRLRV